MHVKEVINIALKIQQEIIFCLQFIVERVDAGFCAGRTTGL